MTPRLVAEENQKSAKIVMRRGPLSSNPRWDTDLSGINARREIDAACGNGR
jgi:hypothetical protein